tara:strand:- start:3910 stop:4104 length:195 start_codon:yes stop_codon:yes gene_type:complete
MSEHMSFSGAFSKKPPARKSASLEGMLRQSGGLKVIVQLDRVMEIADKNSQIGAIQKIMTGEQE